MPQGNCLVPLGIDQFVHPQFVEFAGESLECKKRSTSIAVRIRQFTVAFLITINGIAQPFEFVERRLELRVRQFHILQQCRCGEFQLWGSLRGACTLIWRVHPQKFPRDLRTSTNLGATCSADGDCGAEQFLTARPERR
jgi:hypothetical protein